MIGIVDYGLGNVSAFENIYRRLNIPVVIVKSVADFDRVDRLVLPGVGAFDQAMARLMASGMRGPLEDFALRRTCPVLGVCVGMQIMGDSSEEGSGEGLGWIKGQVLRLKNSTDADGLRLPHMGWNDILANRESALLRGLERGARFYFLHSYAFSCAHPEEVTAETSYGGKFACAISRGNIHGVQFHPEKSHGFGVQLLKNFAEM